MNSRQKLIQQRFLNNEQAVIKRLEQVYGTASKDINDTIKNLQLKIDDLQLQYDWLDPDDPERARIKSMIQSKIYQKKYQEALAGQVDGILKQMQTKGYLTISDYLNECYEDGFVGGVFDLYGQDVPMLIPLDQTKMVRAVQLDSKISHGLYTRLGEDVGLLKQKITAQVSRSIATGASFAETARQLAGYTRIGYNNAVRISRTEGHRIQTTAAMDVMEAAKEKGADVVKQWDAALDKRTRDSHARVDGEIREVNKRFSNGLMYPGDPNGAAAEVINCRCALLQRARWALGDDELQTLKDRAEFFGLDKTDTFEDFKATYMPVQQMQFSQIGGKATPPVAYDGVFDDFAELVLSKQEEKAFADLWEASQNTGFEHGLVIENGVVGGMVTSGLPDNVKVPLDGYGNGLTVLHSHTNATPFSSADFRRLLDGKVDKIGVIGYNGDAYLAYIGYGETPSIEEFDTFLDAVRREVDADIVGMPDFFDWSVEERNYMAIREQAYRIAQNYGWTLEGGRLNGK